MILYGEPGTGKTLLAKAVANSTSATFLRVVGSELIQKYLGDGPKLVRELFRVADEQAPSIVFIGGCGGWLAGLGGWLAGWGLLFGGRRGLWRAAWAGQPDSGAGDCGLLVAGLTDDSKPLPLRLARPLTTQNHSPQLHAMLLCSSLPCPPPPHPSPPTLPFSSSLCSPFSSFSSSNT